MNVIKTEEMDKREFFKARKFSEIEVENNTQEEIKNFSDEKDYPNKEHHKLMTNPVKANGGKHFPKKKATMRKFYSFVDLGPKLKIGQSLLQPNDKISNSPNDTNGSNDT